MVGRKHYTDCEHNGPECAMGCLRHFLRPNYAFLFPVLAMILGIAARRMHALRGLPILGLLILLVRRQG